MARMAIRCDGSEALATSHTRSTPFIGSEVARGKRQRAIVTRPFIWRLSKENRFIRGLASFAGGRI